MNDSIAALLPDEIKKACFDILGIDLANPFCNEQLLVGLIILKLQEWGCGINYPFNEKKWFSYHAGFMTSIEDVSLQVVFLKTAQALGHWSPPKKVEEKFEYLRRKSDGAVRHLKEFNPEFREDWERVTVIPYNDSYAFIPQK